MDICAMLLSLRGYVIRRAWIYFGEKSEKILIFNICIGLSPCAGAFQMQTFC